MLCKSTTQTEKHTSILRKDISMHCRILYAYFHSWNLKCTIKYYRSPHTLSLNEFQIDWQLGLLFWACEIQGTKIFSIRFVSSIDVTSIHWTPSPNNKLLFWALHPWECESSTCWMRYFILTSDDSSIPQFTTQSKSIISAYDRKHKANCGNMWNSWKQKYCCIQWLKEYSSSNKEINSQCSHFWNKKFHLFTKEILDMPQGFNAISGKLPNMNL